MDTSRPLRTLEQGLVRELDPHVRRGHSVPRVRRDLRDHRVLKYPAYAAIAWWRSGLPAKAERALRRGECEALMSHYARHPPARQADQSRRGHLYVWTVDDADQIA